MTTEGTYIYSCPMPDHNTLQGGPIPSTGVITISTPIMLTDQDQIQSLIDTVASQQEEIEYLKLQVEICKQAIALARSYMTPRQLESLGYMSQLLRAPK
jgi:hypothetical protein